LHMHTEFFDPQREQPGLRCCGALALAAEGLCGLATAGAKSFARMGNVNTSSSCRLHELGVLAIDFAMPCSPRGGGSRYLPKQRFPNMLPDDSPTISASGGRPKHRQPEPPRIADDEVDANAVDAGDTICCGFVSATSSFSLASSDKPSIGSREQAVVVLEIDLAEPGVGACEPLVVDQGLGSLVGLR